MGGTGAPRTCAPRCDNAVFLLLAALRCLWHRSPFSAESTKVLLQHLNSAFRNPLAMLLLLAGRGGGVYVADCKTGEAFQQLPPAEVRCRWSAGIVCWASSFSPSPWARTRLLASYQQHGSSSVPWLHLRTRCQSRLLHPFPSPDTALTEPLCDSHFGLLALELMAARRGALPPYVSLDIPWSPRH